jgi:hypothetical protein
MAKLNQLGLLAADSRAKGVGKILVEWALEYAAFELASIVGFRFITVDALYDPEEDPSYDASGFYEKLGFRFVHPTEIVPKARPYQTMYFDLKPIIDLSLSENFS